MIQYDYYIWNIWQWFLKVTKSPLFKFSCLYCYFDFTISLTYESNQIYTLYLLGYLLISFNLHASPPPLLFFPLEFYLLLAWRFSCILNFAKFFLMVYLTRSLGSLCFSQIFESVLYMMLFDLQTPERVFSKNTALSLITIVVNVRKWATKQHAIYPAKVIQILPNVPEGSW